MKPRDREEVSMGYTMKNREKPKKFKFSIDAEIVMWCNSRSNAIRVLNEYYVLKKK